MSLLYPVSFYFIYRRDPEDHLFELFLASCFFFPKTVVLLLYSFVGFEEKRFAIYLLLVLLYSISLFYSSLHIRSKQIREYHLPFAMIFLFFLLYPLDSLSGNLLVHLFSFIIVPMSLVTIYNFMKSKRYSFFTHVYMAVFVFLAAVLNLAPLFLILKGFPLLYYFVGSNTIIICAIISALLDITYKSNQLLVQTKNANKEPFFIYNATVGKMVLWNDAFANHSSLTADRINNIKIMGIEERENNPVIIETSDNRALLFSLTLWKIESKSGHRFFIGREISGGDAENDFFNNLYKFTDSGVIVYDAIDEGRDFLIYDVNPMAEDLLGRSRKEIIGMRLSDLIPTSLINGLMDSLARSYRTKEKLIVSIKDYKDGQVEFWMENRIFPIPSGRIVAVFNNQTEKYQLQEQINQLEKMEQLGLLTGGVAHDFNNQLAIILGYSDLIKSGTSDETILKYLENINRSVLHSRELTSKLLSYSRQGNGQLEEHCINNIVNEFVSVIKHTFDKRIEIEFTDSCPESFILANDNLLQNVLLNLAINARDAMDNRGKLKISLSADHMKAGDFPQGYEDLDSGFYALISIEDNGCGMDKALMDKIFQPLFTTKDSGKGTGMGLSLVLDYIDLHKGAISLASEIDRGTEFTIYLPIVSNLESVEEKAAESSGDDLDAHVLIVDDEESILLTMSHILKEFSCEVTTCGNSEESVGIFKEMNVKPDLVILDYNMPGISGSEVFRQLKEIDDSIKVIFMSGYINGDEQKRLLEEGVSRIMIKPVRISLLISSIREVLDGDKMVLS